MSLQKYLVKIYKNWQPPAPEVVSRTKSDITLRWDQLEPFDFLSDGDLLYKIEKNNKIPPWVVVYSGGKTTKTIDNLAPRHPHRFRLKVIIKASAVPHLADKAKQFYGDEEIVYIKFNHSDDTNTTNLQEDVYVNVDELETNDIANDIADICNGDSNTITTINEVNFQINGKSQNKGNKLLEKELVNTRSKITDDRKWLESLWSEETWTNTDTDGTSAVCFSMAVRCGYLKQVQTMLEERPELIDIINSNNGFTPLATAVRKGDINTVRLLLSAGADINQPSSTGQFPLHLAVFTGNTTVVDLLLEKGAEKRVRDWNGLQIEHYAVDSGSLNMLKFILDIGGDIHAQDNNGWTPLFRAVCQEAKTEIVEELVIRGSDVEAKDIAGLPLTSVARLVKNRHGRNRDSILRLVDSSYPHEKALENFTRLTKKIYNVHSLLNLV